MILFVTCVKSRLSFFKVKMMSFFSRAKVFPFLLLLSFVGIWRGTNFMVLMKTNHVGLTLLSQSEDFSIQRIFSTNQNELTLSQNAHDMLANSRWFERYYSCILDIQNSDLPSLDPCGHIPYLGLGLLQVINQDHANQVTKQQDLSTNEIVEIQREGTRLAIVAVKLLQMESPPAAIWADAGRPLERIVLLMNEELAPYLVIVRTQAVDREPDNAAYRRELGKSLLLAGLPLKAIKQLNHAITQDEEDDQVYDLLALAHYQLSDLEKAEWYARQALMLNPTTNHTYYRRLGEICEAKKDIDCAIESYRTLLAMKPGDAFAIIRLKELEKRIEQ